MKNKFEYTVIRSRRSTICVQIKPEGVVVRAPYLVTNAQIKAFLKEREAWIEKHLMKVREQQRKAEQAGILSEEDHKRLRSEALRVLPERVRYYAPLVGVDYGRISVRCQKTRWGSCTAQGNLNFNYLLMLAPPEVQDSVVVHELCHRLYMNHSADFYREVLRVFPDYRRCRQWLLRHEEILLRGQR